MPPSRLLFALVAGAGFVLAWFVYLPGYLLRLSATWEWPQGHHPLLMLAGGSLIAVGVGVVVVCTVAFARDGRGTPVPFVPPKRLVETGLYGWSRNPMYVAYVAVLLGDSLYFGSAVLVLYAGVVFVGLHLSVILREEPELRRRHGGRFEAYRSAVPRWL